MPEFMQVMEAMDSWNGYNKVKRVNEAEQARFLDLINNTERMPAHRHEFMVREVISTDSFPNLFGFTLERDMLARYRAAVPDWSAYCATGRMANFTEGEMHKVMGNTGLMPRVAQKGEYLVQAVANAHYHRQVFKYGMQFDISWEATVNDMLNAFDDLPARFADAVEYTRAYNVTDLITAAAGPDGGLYGAPIADVDGANVTNLGALALTIANLETTIALMAMQTDPTTGAPLGIAGVHLVVPPLLYLTARTIITSAVKQWTEVGAGAGIPEPTLNILADPELGLKVHKNPILPIIDVSGNVNTTWYLFAEPARGKAIQMDFLRGEEDPEITMKASNKVSVTGAPMSPFTGDFESDDIMYRVRDVHGGTQLDPRYTYAQVG